MKHLAFLFMIAFVSLTSCSKDEVETINPAAQSLIVVNGESDFNSKIATGVTLAYFHSKGCSICAAQRPKVAALVSDNELVAAQLLEIDFESNQTIVNKNGVFGFPTILIFKDGTKVHTLNGGGHSTQKIKDLIKALL